jgi:hypothetical protein
MKSQQKSAVKVEMQFLEHHRSKFLSLHAELRKVNCMPGSPLLITTFDNKLCEDALGTWPASGPYAFNEVESLICESVLGGSLTMFLHLL